jgi:hypothetical protein
MTVTLALVTLLLRPWHGPSLPTASPAAVKYKLTVHGPAEQRLELNAQGLPAGWVASFCTKTLCSPFRYGMELNDRGIGTVEFQAIRTDDSAPRHVQVKVTATGAQPIDVKI